MVICTEGYILNLMSPWRSLMSPTCLNMTLSITCRWRTSVAGTY